MTTFLSGNKQKYLAKALNVVVEKLPQPGEQGIIFFYKPVFLIHQSAMLHLPRQNADLENTATWAKFSPKLCSHCSASCCSLPVEVTAQDLVRMALVDEFSLTEDAKFIARRLMKARLVEHFHARTATFTLARRANGDCIYLDSRTRRCAIYATRPDTCRNHPRIGPRSGYCAFRVKNSSQTSSLFYR